MARPCPPPGGVVATAPAAPAGMPPTVFLHDGSFPGFLCAAAELLNATLAGPAPDDTSMVRFRGQGLGLFESGQEVPGDLGRAARVWERLATKAGRPLMQTILEAFCSDHPGADRACARVLVMAWRAGGAVLDQLGDPAVLAVERAAGRTRAEANLFLGLVRFAELADGSWYAGIRPDCAVLRFLGDHFAARFPDRAWAIHDERRGAAALGAPGQRWRLVSGFRLAPPPDGAAAAAERPAAGLYSQCERQARAAWRQYFAAVAIAERRNPGLQANHLPRKYRDHLPELADDAAGG